MPVIYSEVWFPFAFGFLFLAFLFPALRASFQIVVLASLRLGWKVPQRGRIFRWSEELRLWSMTDIVVIAGAVAYFRANISADVTARAGAWCYIAVGRARLHRRSDARSSRHLERHLSATASRRRFAISPRAMSASWR